MPSSAGRLEHRHPHAGTDPRGARFRHVPRYHLNLFLDQVISDEEGIDRPNLASAIAEARSGGKSLLIEQLAINRPLNLRHRIEVTDEIGRVLATISFRELVTIIDD